MDAIIERRLNQKRMGFGANVHARGKHQIGDLFSNVEPEDLLQYGLIPEFIGRLPVVATLDELDESALVRILTEPKNAIIRQYQKLMTLDDVKLKFTEGALGGIARKAYKQKTGARGLRAILELIMLDVIDRKSTRLNSSHTDISRMPSSA